MEDTLKILQVLHNLTHLHLRDGYEGEQFHIEGGGFQKLKRLGLVKLGGLNRLIIDEGALPLLESLVIARCPQLKEVPSGIHHLKNLKLLKFEDMSTEFVLSLQQDEGPDFGKVKHIPSVTFWYRIRGGTKCPCHFQEITSMSPPTFLLDRVNYQSLSHIQLQPPFCVTKQLQPSIF